jgi:VWFA-related protein
MTRIPARLTVLVAALFTTAPVDAIRHQRPALSSGTEAVLVDVLVSDGGRQITALTAADFLVRDNGVLQQVELIEATAIPQNLFLVLDTGSDTVVDAFEGFAQGVAGILQKLEPRDRVGLLSFSHRTRLLSPLTTDRTAVMQQFVLGRPDRHSAVADALYVTALLSRDEPGRSIAIVFTQGDDSASWLSRADALAAARRSNALVYGVTLHRLVDAEAKGFAFRTGRREDLTRSLSSVRSGVDPSGVLHQVAAATGGRVIYGDTSVAVETTRSAILEEFRKRYILAYRPTARTPGWHELSVSLSSKRGTVSARKGYFVSR